MIRERTIIDAILIAAASSTNNRDEKRDTKMHCSRKRARTGSLGTNADIEVDAKPGLAHALVTIAGNVSGTTQTTSGCTTTRRGCSVTPATKRRQASINYMGGGNLTHRGEAQRAPCYEVESTRPGERKVEHPTHVLKKLVRHWKMRYCGSAKSTAQLHKLFSFADLVLAGRTCGSTHARTSSRAGETSVAAVGSDCHTPHKFERPTVSTIVCLIPVFAH